MKAKEFFDKLYPNYPDDYKEEWVQKRELWREKTIKNMEAFLDHKIEEAEKANPYKKNAGLINHVKHNAFLEALNKLKEL